MTTTTPDTTRRMDGYIRVSRRMGRSGPGYISPTVQREAIERWATYKNVEIVEWFFDEDQSGGTQRRPKLERTIARALAGETDGIVSWKIDRFSRFTEGALRDLRRLQEVGADLAFVVEDIDTGTTYGKMIYTILLAVSEAFLANIKASWIETKERAVRRGAYISRTPFGYKRNDDGTLSPHEEWGQVVAETYRLAAGGDMQTALAYLLEHAAEVKRPKKDGTVRVQRTRWTLPKVRRLLAARSYLGETRNGEMVQVDTHPALVSRAVWEAAQTTPQRRRAKEVFPLSGLLTCGTCGRPMAGSRGGRHAVRMYRCPGTHSQQIRSGPRCPQAAAITAENVERYLHDEARERLSALYAEISEPQGGNSLADLESEILELEDELNDFIADTTLRRKLGNKYHAALDQRIANVESKRGQYAERARDAESAKLLQVDELLSLDDPQLFLAGLRSVFDRIVVKPGRGLSPADRLIFPSDSDEPAGVASA